MLRHPSQGLGYEQSWMFGPITNSYCIINAGLLFKLIFFRVFFYRCSVHSFCFDILSMNFFRKFSTDQLYYQCDSDFKLIYEPHELKCMHRISNQIINRVQFEIQHNCLSQNSIFGFENRNSTQKMNSIEHLKITRLFQSVCWLLVEPNTIHIESSN